MISVTFTPKSCDASTDTIAIFIAHTTLAVILHCQLKWITFHYKSILVQQNRRVIASLSCNTAIITNCNLIW